MPHLSEQGAWLFTAALFAFIFVMLAMRSLWHLIQGTIVIAVICSNIYWQWTPNGYLANILAGFAAYFFTVLVVKIADFFDHLFPRETQEPH